jgi:hypothetical protein
MDIIRCIPKRKRVEFCEGDSWFPVRGAPKMTKSGSRNVLFIANRGAIVGMAVIKGIESVDPEDDMSYLEQGSPRDPESYRYLHVGKIKRLTNRPAYRGHVGIRYVGRLKSRSLRTYLQQQASRLKRQGH